MTTKKDTDTSVSTPDTQATTDTQVSYITLPGSAFFDEELWAVLYQKVFKTTPPKSKLAILLRAQKLAQEVSAKSTDLSKLRDEIATECGLAEYMVTPPTAEVMQSPAYQESSQKFWEKVQEKLFAPKHELSVATLKLNPTDTKGVEDNGDAEYLSSLQLSPDELSLLIKYGIFEVVS